jgi:hypothetical protein
MPMPRAENPKPSSRYRRGHRDPEARGEHTRQSRVWRRALRDADFDQVARTAFLAALAACGDVVQAADVVGHTHGVVYGRMRRDTVFAEAVEDILAGACRAVPLGTCGLASGYKSGGRCRSCRDAHHVRTG